MTTTTVFQHLENPRNGNPQVPPQTQEIQLAEQRDEIYIAHWQAVSHLIQTCQKMVQAGKTEGCIQPLEQAALKVAETTRERDQIDQIFQDMVENHYKT